MPTVTGAQLLAQVRSLADEPDDGNGNKSYVTDAEIYVWLSDHYRNAVRGMARGGYPYAFSREDFSSPGASVTLATDPLAITGVYVQRSSTLYRLPRLVFSEEVQLTGSQARYWQPAITQAGVFSLNLYPSQSSDTVKVYYIPEPSDIASATSVHLPSTWKRVIVLAAALDCYTKRNAVNQSLARQYTEALADAEAEAAHYAETVVQNTDAVYPPGYDQGEAWDGQTVDYSVYLVP